MARLNYLHLEYFWSVAREGGVSAAARSLRMSPASLSAAVQALERRLGQRLFHRAGKKLVLTDVGREVLRQADEIFARGRQLERSLERRQFGQSVVIGVADVIPKAVSHRFLAPALETSERPRLTVREGSLDALCAQLAAHELDLVLADAPSPPAGREKLQQQLLGESGITFFATRRESARLRRSFPRSLSGRPFLLPAKEARVRLLLETWFDEHSVEPEVAGEFDDSALLKVFGQHGAGVFVAPSLIEAEVARAYGVVAIGRTDEIRESFYALTTRRRIENAAVTRILAAAPRPRRRSPR